MNILLNIHKYLASEFNIYQTAQMNSSPENYTDSVEQKILDAAWSRFSHFGLGKTTMNEIAEDCGMSAANIYRFFKNKNEIARTCCQRFMEETNEELRKIVRKENISARKKLESYALRITELNISRASDTSKMGELVANMTENNAEIIHQKVSSHHALIAEILAQGNANNEFAIEDVLKTAEVIYTSLVVFDVPLFAQLYPAEKYQKLASEMIDLLVNGLKPKKP